MATAFIENPEGKREVNHKDGNKQNNRVENLEWMTTSENQKHAYDVLKRGARHGVDHAKAKLNPDIVRAIRRAKENGGTQRGIAAKFGVHRNTVAMVLSGETWKHVS